MTGKSAPDRLRPIVDRLLARRTDRDMGIRRPAPEKPADRAA
ncbi:hypothetical protein [Symbioplanes lichenis]|nr:hypothetical protein [Actinoplanes lichenis]